MEIKITTGTYNTSEFMVALGGIRSFGFKDGQMWEANTNSVCCNFFGTQYKGVIQIVVNPFPGC